MAKKNTFCIESSPFGFGPFPEEDGVVVCAPNPPGRGYGAQSIYGFSPYGSHVFPRSPFPPVHGYGAEPYGMAPYGNVDSTGPNISSAVSVNGTSINVYFSEPVFWSDLRDESAWSISADFGADPTVDRVRPLRSSEPLRKIDPDTGKMATMVVGIAVFHSGTVLGGSYQVECRPDCLRDSTGNFSKSPYNKSSFLALGEDPECLVLATSGNTLNVYFKHPMGDGLEDLNSFEILPTDYPVKPVITKVEKVSHKIAKVTVNGLTSLVYDFIAGPADAIEYLPANGLPSEGAFELGSGESYLQEQTPNTPSYLLLNKQQGAPYGWHFAESDTNRLKPGCVIRMDFAMDASTAVWNPLPMTGTLMGIHLCDDDVQASLLFGRQDGNETVTLSSGSLNLSVACAWSTDAATFSVIRNQYTKHWAVLFNGQPILSVALDKADGAPTMSAGVQFVLGSSFEVLGLPVLGLSLTASSTLYSKIGNFLHSSIGRFKGKDGHARKTLRTQRGPLTKGWGDSRPATIEDVAVRVNGTAVEVVGVNPYVGEVEVDIPIPRMPAGEIDVEVDYQWFPNPRMEMTSLNTMGLVLNKWDNRNGRNSSSVSLRDGGGSREGERFPMCIGIGQPPQWNPKWISHRHIGFEREYTAALNEPTSLVLNANPYLYSPKREVYENSGFMSSFDGGSLGDWKLTEGVTGKSGTSGYFTIQTSEFGGVKYDVPLAFCPSSMRVNARTQADELPDDGFYIGPVMAFHDNNALKCVAAIKLDSIEHYGILEGEDPTDIESWNIGPKANASLTSSNTLVVPPESTPPLFKAGHRIQVRSGVQAGIYECISRQLLSDGSVAITVKPDFPTDVDSWGGGSTDILFEASWSDDPFTWSLIASSNKPGVTLSFSGTTAWTFSSTSAGPPIDSLPPQVVSSGGTGEVLWGHLLTDFAYNSSWSFVRQSGIPLNMRQSSIGHLVTAEMSDLPQDNGEWFRNSAIGHTSINGDGTVRINPEATSANGGLSVGYERVDPLVPINGVVEVQGRFKVTDSGTCSGAAGLTVKGTTRDIRVSTLLYSDFAGRKKLTEMPNASLAGDATPEERGWSKRGRLEAVAENRVLRIFGARGGYSYDLTDQKALVLGSGVSRRMQARMSLSASDQEIDTGVVLTMEAGSPARLVGLGFLNGPRRVQITDGTDTKLTVECDWTEEHTYEVVAEHTGTPTVTLYIDGKAAGSTSLVSFQQVGLVPKHVGILSYDSQDWELELHAFSVSALPTARLKRTVGIYKGGDPDNIDSWVVPREDVFQGVRNSRRMARIKEVDWRQWTHLRVTVDPNWGVSVLLPEKPLPPTYSAKRQATSHTNPSAAWCTLEWDDIPLLRVPHTRFGFGSIHSRSVSPVDWDFYKYRVFFHKDEGTPVLRGAVLNRYNVITSGELGQDLTVDEAQIPFSGQHIDLRKGHVSAKQIFNVLVDGVLVPKAGFSFDKPSQVITLETSYANSKAVVKFSPGAPVTRTYLENQPLYDGVTNLNEGTPPMAWSRSKPWLRGFLPASRINEVSDVLNIDDDFVLNDPLGSITFKDDKSDVYADISFMEISDEGHTGKIAIADDGPAPGQGFAGIEIEGRAVHERVWETVRPSYDQRGGSMGGLLHLAGGNNKHTGTLGGGGEVQGSVIWPSAPARPSEPNPGAAELQTKWDVRTSYNESVGDPSFDGSYTIENGGPYARFGPWGGIDSLNNHSLLSGGPDAGTGMVLQGGGPLPPSVWSFGQLPE